MSVERRGDWSVWLGAFWLAGLMAVHPLPHTGAVRSLLVLIALVHIGVLFWRRPLPQLPRPGIEGALLMLLTGWLIVQSALFAQSPAISALAKMVREWGKLLGMAGLGIGLAVFVAGGRAQVRDEARVTTWLFLGFFVHVPLTLGYHGWLWWRTGQLPVGESPLGNYGYVSLLVNAALAFLLAEAAGRFCRRERLLPWSDAGVALAVAATLVANALLTSKAGLIMTHLLGWTFLAAVLWQGTVHRRALILAVLLGLGLATIAGVMVENRWAGAVDSITAGAANAVVPIANQAPVASPLIERPSLLAANGNDPSFYIRSLSARMGLRGIAQYPFGIGYGADAFGRYIASIHGVPGLISSENGWIDFTLANGLPAMALLLVLCGVLMWRGWQTFRAGNTVGLALSLATLNYIGRCALDGYLTGSRLTVFALMAGVLWGLSASPRSRHGADPA